MESFLSLFTALWIGILTSISPCPLATNVAAVSFVSYRINNKGTVLLSGILYIIGRSLTYIILAVIIVQAMVNIPILSDFLQRYINKILGILLIIVGMYLLDLIRFNFIKISPSEKVQNKLDKIGIAGPFLLGGLFALAFCPVSAALYFGSLIPLAIKVKSSVVIPFMYGIGTGLPVLVFAVLVVVGAGYVSKLYNKIVKIEFYIRKATGVIFILIGIYYVLIYIFELF